MLWFTRCLWRGHTWGPVAADGTHLCEQCHRRACAHTRRHMVMVPLGYLGDGVAWVCDFCQHYLGFVEGAQIGGWRYPEINAKIEAGQIPYKDGTPYITHRLRQQAERHQWKDTTGLP